MQTCPTGALGDQRAMRNEKVPGEIERTRVSLTVTGPSLALTRLLTSTQRPRDGRVLHVDEVEMVPSRSKEDEVRLELTLVIARMAAPEETET